MLNRVITVALVLAIASSCQGYKGLFVTTFGAKSHLNYFESIINALTENGHQIVYVSPLKARFEDESVKQVIVPDRRDELFGSSKFSFDIFRGMFHLLHEVSVQCVKVLADAEVQAVLKQDFDYAILSIFYADCFLAYAHEKKIPLIYVSQNSLAFTPMTKTGIPVFPSMTSWLSNNEDLSFRERVVNCFFKEFFAIPSMLYIRKTDEMCREKQLWQPDTPPIWDLMSSFSLVIANSVRALEKPVQFLPPNIVYAGGIHIRPRKPLPQDIEQWMSGSGDNGVILFSLGTTIKAFDSIAKSSCL